MSKRLPDYVENPVFYFPPAAAKIETWCVTRQNEMRAIGILAGPDGTKELWDLWKHPDGHWVTGEKLGVICCDAGFMRCHGRDCTSSHK